MTETRRIKLHLAKCMEDLDKMYSVPEIKHKKAIMLCKTALKLFEAAEQAKDKGDEEYSYVCYMKYLRLIAYIGKDQEYLREKKYYNDLLGVKNPNKALSAADMLRNSLIDRYANEQNTKRMNDLKDDYKHMSDDSRKKAKESAPDPPPQLGLPGQQEVTITSQHLYSLLKNTNLKIMILDARLMMDYVESHIEHPNCINVPEDAIKPGKSANALEQSLSPAAKLVWAERATMDLIVMLDWDSKTAIPGKSLFLLKTILLKWDIKVQYSRTPVALSGGYEDWLLLYPHHTTNAQVTRLLKSQSEDMLSEIDYPSWSDLSPPPTKMEMPGGPIIDRSSKAAALQMYLERSRNMQMILQKQEKIADTSLTLELQRIEAEQDWEKVHQESENEPQGDMRAQYQLREQEILSKLLQLENKQYDMEQENKSLRDQLEEYQRREKDESSKMADSIVTNQEAAPTNVESEKQRARELDAAREFDAARARIRAAEEQKADLHRKREVLEGERRRLLQEAREKKKPDYKEEDADTFMASGSMHRSQSSPDVAKLSSSEEETSAPIFDRSTKPMIRHEPMRIRDLQPVWGEVGPGLTGLKNLGNTCYMNSIIQCLNNTTALASYFSKGQYLEHVNRSNSTRGIIAEELAAVMHALWSGQYRFIAIDDLRREVGRHQRAFRGSEQQDSHEFLTILMDWLHDDLQFHVPSPHKDRLQPADKAWLDYTGSRESLILRLFHGQLSSSVACTRCAARSRTYDSFSNLSLSLPAARADLADCLKLYLNDETIPGWNCPTCKEKRTAIKKLDISRLPPVLVIHLKRFYLDPKDYMSNAYRKKQTYIDFPLDELNMSEFAPHIPDAVYKLYAVSNHYGSMESGHYTAYCKSSVNGRWYKYDDHLVSEISANEVKSSAAYILFYTACRQRRT